LTYSIALEDFERTYAEIEPLYRTHYGEMQARLASLGRTIGPYKPRLDEYLKACRGGYLLTFIARKEGKPVGYCNVYLTNDMHNGEPIAVEDTVYVLPAHRNGLGRKLILFGLEELKKRGALRLNITTRTDPRVVRLLERIGFVPVAVQMTYEFSEKR
jgi:GNAT superfamily N-acetyltransferase